MTVPALVTTGIGLGSSALFLMTGGLGSSDVTPVPPPPPPVGGDDAPRGVHGAYRRGERRRRGLEWDKPREDLLERLERAYAKAIGEELPAEQVAAIAAAVAPHVEVSSDTKLPPLQAIDWVEFARDLQAVNALLLALAWAQDEDEAITLLLMS